MAPVIAPAWWPHPPLGDAIASGNLWPAATGREVLRRLASVEPRPRPDLVAQHGDPDDGGKDTTVVYDAGGWCLKTSRGRRFDDLDAARVALVKLARTKIALGSLTLPNTVLVTSGDPARGCWVWTFAPWRTTLRAAIRDAVAANDDHRLGDALVQFATAVTEGLVRALRAGQGLDLRPSNFAVDGDALVYLDDELIAAPPVPGTAHAILQRAEELAGHAAALERYAASLIEQLRTRLTGDELARLRLIDDLRATPARVAATRTLRIRLLAAFDPAFVPPLTALAAAAAQASAPTRATGAPAAPRPAWASPSLAPPPLALEAWPLPPTAAAHLPSGFIWPVVAGRELVRQLFHRTPTPRDGRPFSYELGDYVLSTSADRRFVEVDDARAELLRLARAQVAGGAPQPGVVLVLAPDDARGGHWIWTIAPIAGDAPAPP